jgi:hypothetical protein
MSLQILNTSLTLTMKSSSVVAVDSLAISRLNSVYNNMRNTVLPNIKGPQYHRNM